MSKTLVYLVVYSQPENIMRIHLKSCLEQSKLTLFPTLKKRRLSTEDLVTETVELCPLCMLPDDGEMMVYCEESPSGSITLVWLNLMQQTPEIIGFAVNAPPHLAIKFVTFLLLIKCCARMHLVVPVLSIACIVLIQSNIC